MAEFKPNVPVVQPEPQVSVDVTAANPLAVGTHIFTLVVTDDAGNESAPVQLAVLVVDTTKPTAVLQFVTRDGVPTRPVVPQGASFFLSGKESKDIPPG